MAQITPQDPARICVAGSVCGPARGRDRNVGHGGASGIQPVFKTDRTFSSILRKEKSPGTLSADELRREHQALDLVGPLHDLQDLGVAEELLHQVILHVAVAAVDLHRVGGDLHGEVAAEGLGV